MTCENCNYCVYPIAYHSSKCKCKRSKLKLIGQYVSGGYTPNWCPLKANEPPANSPVENDTKRRKDD